MLVNPLINLYYNPEFWVYSQFVRTTMARIFITGAAGFIGFHLAQRLHDRGDYVIGLDNFNDYYTPILKRRRAEELAKKGIKVIEHDITDFNYLKKSVE